MKKFLSLLAILLLFIPSCKENAGTEIDYNPNVLSSRDYIRGEDAIFEVVNSFFKGVYDSLVNQTGYNFIDNCDVTYHPAQNALVFGYGSENRGCQDGKNRRGNFIATFSGEIFSEDVVASVITDSLFVDDYLVEIKMEISNLGLNAENKNEFSLVVDSSDIMLPDTTKLLGVRISTDYLMVWEQGSSTPTIHEDDMFLVSGTGSGISTDNYAFSLNIQQPFENWLDCYWLNNGTSQITVPVAEIPTGEIVKEDSCSNQYFFYFNESTFYDLIK